jgi:hypothetical protein
LSGAWGKIAQLTIAMLMAGAAPAFAGDEALVTVHGGGIFGSSEFGPADDDITSGFIGGSLSLGPLILTADQDWMNRDFDFGGNADFSAITGAAALQLLTTEYIGIAAHAAYADGSIDFSGGGERDYAVFRIGGDLSINFAKILGFDLENSGVGLYGSSGYVEVDDGFAPDTNMSGFYSTTGAALQATQALTFCVDGGYANLSGEGAPDADYWEAGGGVKLDIGQMLGFERSGAALHGDVHFGETARNGDRDDNVTFQAGASFSFGPPVIDRTALVATYDAGRVEGCDFGALVPMIDRRLKLAF